jgi:arylsulfatase A-like enzyme
MAGAKHFLMEGGIRNYLIVQGPGVKPGAIDNTMITISDIFPTMVDIAGIAATVPQGPQLDGLSFKSVLLPSGSSNKNKSMTAGAGADADAEAAGGSEAAQQSSLIWRYFFMLGPACWVPDAVPALGADR